MARNEPPDFEAVALRERSQLNTNSYISISLMALLIACVIWLKDGQTTNAIAQNNLTNKIDDLSRRLDEQNRNIFSKVDFMHWTNQLQRDNSNAGVKIVVPEIR